MSRQLRECRAAGGEFQILGDVTESVISLINNVITSSFIIIIITVMSLSPLFCDSQFTCALEIFSFTIISFCYLYFIVAIK